MEQETKNQAAAELGKLGGQKTAERGPEYYAEIQAKRKVRAGGRPKGPIQAAHEGVLKIGSAEIPCAVLEGGTRVLNQAGFLRAIGRARSPKAGTGVLSTIDELPFFLQADVLKPFITEELRASTKPIFYKSKKRTEIEIPPPSKEGIQRFPRVPSVGYDARLLPQVCEVYLRFRDDSLKRHRRIPARYEHIFAACDILMRGLAHTGIIALVDEATGYQYFRARTALEEILDRFIAKEFRKWAKRFPDDFYREMFRLWRWVYDEATVKRTPLAGKLTKDLVYDRLAPGVRQELERKNPKDSRGRRKQRHHQWLTEDVGDPRLREHLASVIALMRASDTREDFLRMINRSLPRYLPAPLFDGEMVPASGVVHQ